jgi:hypothetical protein
MFMSVCVMISTCDLVEPVVLSGVEQSEFYGEDRHREIARLYEASGNVPLLYAGFKTFELVNGTRRDYHCYKAVTDTPEPVVLDVKLFHGKLQKYGPTGKCFRIPMSMLRDRVVSNFTAMWFVQLFYVGEEELGPVYTFNKLVRQTGNYICIPVPNGIVHALERDSWTVAFMKFRGAPSALNGFVYPRYLIGDIMHVADVVRGDL